MSDDQAALVLMAVLLVLLVGLIVNAAVQLVRVLPIDREGREVDRLEQQHEGGPAGNAAWVHDLRTPGGRR